MEITLEVIERLRGEGLSWRQIGVFLAKDGEEPYLLQERARAIWRKSHVAKTETPTIVRKSIKSNRDNTIVSEMTMLGNQANQLNEDGLLRSHGYDPTYWRVIDSTCAKRGDVWSSRVKVTAREVPQLDGDEFATFLSDAVKRLPPVHTPTPRVVMSDKMAIIALYDIHYGRRGIDGDHKRTEQEVESVVEQIVDKLVNHPVEKIVLTIGQDFLNADNIQGTTTGGTPQDNSLSWHDMFSGGLALAMWIIDTLGTVAPVMVVYNEGNHDRVFSYAIVKALEQRYQHSGNISVDSGAEPRKYMTFGNSLIGLSHGKDEVNLSTVMQIEKPQEWGRSTHRYWFLGHLHHLTVDDKDGVTVIRCPSLAFADDWTRRKGFVGADRATLCAIVGQDGLDDIWLIRP